MKVGEGCGLLEQQEFAPWWSFCIWTVQPEPLAVAQSGVEPISLSLSCVAEVVLGACASLMPGLGAPGQ